MKAKIPREWRDMSPAQRKRVDEFIRNTAYEAAAAQEEKDCRIILDIYMKMVCLILHNAFHFEEEDLRMFLGNHKRLFGRQTKLVKKGEQLEFLEAEMAKIFRKEGFPQGFVDDMLGPVDANVKEEKNDEQL